MITLADLEGHWTIQRRIEDARAGLTGTLHGHAVWRPDAEGLVQEETGVLRYGTAPPMHATRRYLWRAEGDVLCVFFEDGRAFHRLGPGALSDRHYCDPDIYDVTYVLQGWPDWRTVWRVTGPRKDMVIDTHFARPE